MTLGDLETARLVGASIRFDIWYETARHAFDLYQRSKSRDWCCHRQSVERGYRGGGI